MLRGPRVCPTTEVRGKRTRVKGRESGEGEGGGRETREKMTKVRLNEINIAVGLHLKYIIIRHPAV